MKSKKRIIRILDIIFWSIIIITAVILFSKQISDELLKNDNISFEQIITSNHSVNEWLNMGFGIFFMILVDIIFSLFIHFFLTTIYIGVRIALKRHSKDKLDENDLKNDTYYRDIINEYSPAVLSYIDDFKLEEKDIIGTIMSLELKKKLKITDKIEVINEDETGLESNEKYIFNHIKNSSLKKINLIYFEKYVIEDAKNNNLLEEKLNIKKNIIKRLIMCAIIYVIIRVTMFNATKIIEMIQNNNEMLMIAMIIMLLMFLVTFFLPISTIIYVRSYCILNKSNPYVRNKKAKEINKKIEGLKNFIKDYSLLKDRDGKEIEIWRDYLIYSVIFGQNTAIIDKIKDALK